MSDDKKESSLETINKPHPYYPPNELIPETMGVCINLALNTGNAAPTRLYMLGNMLGKSVPTAGATERPIVTGNEYQYADHTRSIVAPSNMEVDEVFYPVSVNAGEEETDKWNVVYVVFKNDEKNKYDVLELYKNHTQNTYITFEYAYDKNVMRKLKRGATFPKGTVFAKSPRVSDSGEWMFGMKLKVAAGSFHYTEEDGIAISRSCAETKLRSLFEHVLEYSYNEEDFVPLLLYGTDENPKPFAESGEKIREDGIVLGFRRRLPGHALTTLTKKALRTPDEAYDILLCAPVGSEVMKVEVVSERMKNRSNNRSTDYIEQTHTKLLDRYERKQNEMWNNIISWYESKIAANGGNDIEMTNELQTLVTRALVNYTRRPSGQVNQIRRSHKREPYKDWMISVYLKETVPGRVKFKMAGTQGDKFVIVTMLEDEDMPMASDGTRAELVVNNIPLFRRQIYCGLMEQGILFLSDKIHKEVVDAYNKGDLAGGYQILLKYFQTGWPEYAEIVTDHLTEESDQDDFVIYTVKNGVFIHQRSDSRIYGAQIIRELRKAYGYRPEPVWITNSLGERVLTKLPVMITDQYFMLLDKFGTDMSAQAMPVSNLFGMPAKLNNDTRHNSWIRDQGNRNKGEPESKLTISQSGVEEILKGLTLGYSPEARRRATRRQIRSNNPLNMNQLIKKEEYKLNKAVQMSLGMLSDSGYTLRRETPADITNIQTNIFGDLDD